MAYGRQKFSFRYDNGKKALGERLGEFVKRSDGTFRVITNWAAGNDCFVAASVVSLAERGDDRLKNPGMDLFKIENGKIREVWTFSEHQAAEDKFWDIDGGCGRFTQIEEMKS